MQSTKVHHLQVGCSRGGAVLCLHQPTARRLLCCWPAALHPPPSPVNHLHLQILQTLPGSPSTHLLTKWGCRCAAMPVPIPRAMNRQALEQCWDRMEEEKGCLRTCLEGFSKHSSRLHLAEGAERKQKEKTAPYGGTKESVLHPHPSLITCRQTWRMGAAESRHQEEEGIVTVAAPDAASLDAPGPLLQQLQGLEHVRSAAPPRPTYAPAWCAPPLRLCQAVDARPWVPLRCAAVAANPGAQPGRGVAGAAEALRRERWVAARTTAAVPGPCLPSSALHSPGVRGLWLCTCCCSRHAGCACCARDGAPLPGVAG